MLVSVISFVESIAGLREPPAVRIPQVQIRKQKRTDTSGKRMSGIVNVNAEKRFWKTPELVDKLLPYLPVKDVSELAKVH